MRLSPDTLRDPFFFLDEVTCIRDSCPWTNVIRGWKLSLRRDVMSSLLWFWRLKPRPTKKKVHPVGDVVLIPGLLPIFLYGCEIKSGSGLGTRLQQTHSVCQSVCLPSRQLHTRVNWGHLWTRYYQVWSGGSFNLLFSYFQLWFVYSLTVSFLDWDGSGNGTSWQPALL